MRKVALFLKPGQNWNHNKGVREQPLWEEHARFVDNLFDRGLIMLAGPFTPEGTGALVILNVETIEEARTLYADDPWALREILFIADAREWTVFLDGRDAVT